MLRNNIAGRFVYNCWRLCFGVGCALAGFISFGRISIETSFEEITRKIGNYATQTLKIPKN